MKRLGLSLIELLVVVSIFGLLAALAVPMVARARDNANRTACQSNLKELGAVLRMYADECGGAYPPMHGPQPYASAPDAVGCDGRSLYDRPALGPDMRYLTSEYLSDPRLLVCPSDREAASDNPLSIVRDDGSGLCGYAGLITRPDQSYTYFGYMLDQVDEEDPRISELSFAPGQLVALLLWMRPALRASDGAGRSKLDSDIDLAELGLGERRLGNAKHDTIFRLRKDVIRVSQPYISVFDSSYYESFVPVMWDSVAPDPLRGGWRGHASTGCNVLYLDGHVEFTRYAGQFPATAGVANMVNAL